MVVDNRPVPGGHWVNAYPFVKLHAPSWSYGVNSTQLAPILPDGRIDPYHQATKTEILGYCADLMRGWEASGRVLYYPLCELAEQSK